MAPSVCEHPVRESLRGAGACDIKAEVKRRDGRPNWWCHTHGMAAGAPDGNRLERCAGAWLDPVSDEMQASFDLGDGQVAIWGALEPAISIGAVPPDPGKVHVHHRADGAADKDVDRSYDLVYLRHGDRELTVEGMAAVAYSISELSGRQVTPMRCPHCGGLHIDELKFATFAHRKHLCNSCGRNFRDKAGPSVSNPLAQAYEELELVRPGGGPMQIVRPLELKSECYGGIALWPSNSAIVSTMARAEEAGIHVHAWDEDGEQVIDDTFSEVWLDGRQIDEGDLRALAVQRALAHGAAVIARACPTCGFQLTSPSDGWVEPSTKHTCTRCSGQFRTNRRVFINPLAGPAD